MGNAPVADRSTAEPLDNAFVVVPFNIFVNRLLEFREVVEFLFMSVKKFLLQLRKEILGLAVVQIVAVREGDQEKLHALPAYVVDSLLLEVDVHPEPLELHDGAQKRHSVPRKSGDGLCQDEVKLPGPGVHHHPMQSCPLLLRAGEDFVRVDPRVFSCWFAWIREL